MADISLSKAVRSNLLSLKGTAEMMASTQNRLATGNKVNSALDNPSSWFTAQGLNNRASDLGTLLDSMANGVQTLEAADNGLTAMTKTLESMQSTLRQARQDKSFNTESLTLDTKAIKPYADTVTQLTLSGGAVDNPTSIDLIKTEKGQAVSGAATYAQPAAAGKAKLDGMTGGLTAVAAAANVFTIKFGNDTAEINVGAATGRSAADLATAIQAQISTSALAGKVTFSNESGVATLTSVENADGAIEVTGTNAAAMFGAVTAAGGTYSATTDRKTTEGSDGEFNLTINGKKVSLDVTTGADVEKAAKAINDQLGENSKFEAYEQLGGKLSIRAIKDDAGPLTIGGPDAKLFGTVADGVVKGADADLKFTRSIDELVSVINASTSGLNDKVRASNDNGKLRIENQSTQDLKIEGKNATSLKLDGSAGTSTIKGNSVRTGLAAQFNELRDQLDKLADDASFNGINLLRGDKLSITFNETGTSSIDIQTKNNRTINSSNLGVATTLEAADLDSDSNIDAELSKLKSALNDVRAQASSFGSNLSIVENRQKFTKSMIDTLQSGAGNLTLADMNEEAANLLALQTRQSLSSNSLSLASQADQSVLQLIR